MNEGWQCDPNEEMGSTQFCGLTAWAGLDLGEGS